MNQSEAVSGTARIVRRDEGPSVRWGAEGIVRILAGANSTDQSFSVCEAIEPPGTAAPLHVHHAEAEAFYVVEGEIELTCGEDTITARRGDFAYAPKGVAHKYAVIGDQPARVLLLFSRPGFEGFFVEGGTPLDEPPPGAPDPEKMQRLLDKYDLELPEGWEH